MRPGAGEAVRITVSMTVACALGALILGGVSVGTERHRREGERARERAAMLELLDLDAGARLLEVREYLRAPDPAVVYRAAPLGAPAPGREVTFSLDGARLSRRPLAPGEPVAAALAPLGRIVVATRAGAPAGFVVEGEARGFKDRIRFLVAITPGFEIAGVRVVELAEDPGLGAEVATPWFEGQFAGRTLAEASRLEVTRDPMPEDWRAALEALARRTTDARARHDALLARERGRPVYAVTGATISSRALTLGVRATVEHFRRRWALLAPELQGLS